MADKKRTYTAPEAEGWVIVPERNILSDITTGTKTEPLGEDEDLF